MLQERVPAQTGSCIVVGRVETKILHASISGVFKNVRQVNHVRVHVNGSYAEGLPHLLSVLVIVVRNVTLQLAVKR